MKTVLFCICFSVLGLILSSFYCSTAFAADSSATPTKRATARTMTREQALSINKKLKTNVAKQQPVANPKVKTKLASSTKKKHPRSDTFRGLQ